MKQTMLMSLVLVLTCTRVSSSLSVKSLNEHSAILNKIQSSVEEFSIMLTSAVKGEADLKAQLTNVISKDMAVQMDKLTLMSNGTLSALDDICCRCNHCYQSCSGCGTTCCCNGDQGCTCVTCSTGRRMKLSDVTSVKDATFKMWAESTKLMLKRDVTRLVSKHSQSNDECCACQDCQQTGSGCGEDDCCVLGSGCLCLQCSTRSLLYASSIRDPISLTPEVEKLVAQVDLLVDSLLLHFM